MVTLELSEEGLARLHAGAERRHTSIDAVIEDWAASLPAQSRSVIRTQPSFVAMGSSSSGHRTSAADDMLAEGFGSESSRMLSGSAG